jgi:hypothetical protein
VPPTNPEITPDEIRKRIRGSFPADRGVEPLRGDRLVANLVVTQLVLSPNA